MRTFLAVTLFLLAAWTPGRSQATEGGLLNGHDWAVLPKGVKTMWIGGYVQGVETAQRYNKGNDCGPLPKMQLLPPSMTVSEVVALLDIFYKEPENGPIPVFSAIWATSMRMRGVEDKDVKAYLDSVRSVTKTQQSPK